MKAAYRNKSSAAQYRKERNVGVAVEDRHLLKCVDSLGLGSASSSLTSDNDNDNDDGDYDGGSSSLTMVMMLLPNVPSSLRSLLDSTTNPKPSSSQHLLQLPNLSSAQIVRIRKGVLSGLKCLHSLGYAHLDLKVDNILMTSDGSPVIVDYGSCMSNGEDLTGRITSVTRERVRSLQEYSGTNTTVTVRSPEMFEGGTSPGDTVNLFKCDVWSLGCLVYALHFGWSPFEVEYDRRNGQGLRYVDCTHLRVLSDQYKKYEGQGKLKDVHDRWIDGTRGIYGKCLEVDPRNRCELRELEDYREYSKDVNDVL